MGIIKNNNKEQNQNKQTNRWCTKRHNHINISLGREDKEEEEGGIRWDGRKKTAQG